ncbi:MAG: hypothetical protein WD030_11570 [Pirellulales bacterium]
MRYLLVIATLAVTVSAWGLYGPTLHVGQELMDGARWRPFICVGLAYFVIAVVAPTMLMQGLGEKGRWTSRGIAWSLAAGALGAVGALGIILAFNFGGKPIFVMPLVFGGAPVVNSFITIVLAKTYKQVGPIFLAGLFMVILGAVTVLLFKPHATPPVAPADPATIAAALQGETETEAETEATPPEKSSLGRSFKENAAREAATAASFMAVLLSVALTVCCWGSYGPALHTGQAKMEGSRMRPLICVGLSYFAIAVVVPLLLINGGGQEADSGFTFWGSVWSLAAGAAGAIGALGIIMAFTFGGKPVFVMPLVFGGAPVVNTFATIIKEGTYDQVGPFFLAGLILVAGGAALVLAFAPRGKPPKETPKVEENPKATAGQQPTSEAASGTSRSKPGEINKKKGTADSDS